MYFFCIILVSIPFVITPIFAMDKNLQKPSISIYMDGRYEKTTTSATANTWTTTYTYRDGSSSKYDGKVKK